jgi:dTDP-4-dehydrorhamnose reductase
MYTAFSGGSTVTILITGSRGQVGRALVRLAPIDREVVALDSGQCDVRDFDAVRRQIDRHRPSLIVHAAAMTDVDGCERDPQAAWAVNALGTQHVAAAAIEAGATLV